MNISPERLEKWHYELHVIYVNHMLGLDQKNGGVIRALLTEMGSCAESARFCQEMRARARFFAEKGQDSGQGA